MGDEGFELWSGYEGLEIFGMWALVGNGLHLTPISARHRRGQRNATGIVSCTSGSVLSVCHSVRRGNAFHKDLTVETVLRCGSASRQQQ